MLTVRDLHVSYGAVDAVRGVSMELRGGEIVALLGVNGAGKSTLLRAIMGLVPARAGRIEFDKDDITRRPPLEIVRRGVVLCPEGRELFGELTVLENLKLGATRTGLPWRQLAADLDHATRLFPIVGERLQQRAETLSGGEQQMVAISRALMARPRVLLIDEPSLGLAPVIAHRMFESLPGMLNAERAILIVEQNATLALNAAARAYVMKNGEIVAQGTAQDVRSSYIRTPQPTRSDGVRKGPSFCDDVAGMCGSS